MGSHSYLVNLQTNIGHLDTMGLLNSHASAFTTTNVGQMNGGPSSVISLGELYSNSTMPAMPNMHFTKAQEAMIDARIAKHI